MKTCQLQLEVALPGEEPKVIPFDEKKVPTDLLDIFADYAYTQIGVLKGGVVRLRVFCAEHGNRLLVELDLPDFTSETATGVSTGVKSKVVLAYFIAQTLVGSFLLGLEVHVLSKKDDHRYSMN